MNKRKPDLRNFNARRPNQRKWVTTEELRNRKKQNIPLKRAQDLRSRLNGAGTKVIDARSKLLEKRSVEQLNEKTSITMNNRRKEQRANIHANNRSLSLDSGSIKITSKFPNRSAQVTGESIQITAKVESQNKAKSRNRGHGKDRNLQVNNTRNTGGITIKARSESSPRRRKEDFGVSKLHMDQEENDYYEYKKFKAAQLEKQQRETSPTWKQPLSITDRLDGPFMEPRRTPQPQTSTKVTITNLHPSVTRQDIEELFGVVGVLKSCKMLHPGTAEVVYTIKEDAITAFARYHNRNLDGQPMHCKLSSAQASSTVHSTSSIGSVRPAAPPSPNLFHTPVIPYVPSKRPTAVPQSQPVVFKVKI